MARIVTRANDETPVARSASASAQRGAWMLALCGAIPFIGLTLLLFALGERHPLRELVQDALATYGALILSFLGGIRWGRALRATDLDRALPVFALSVVPSLIGWFALLAPRPHVFAILAVAFAAQGAWDAYAGLPAWFARLRLWLSVIVTATLGLAVLSGA